MRLLAITHSASRSQLDVVSMNFKSHPTDSAQQLELWILQSADPRQPQTQHEATVLLQDWFAHRPSLPLLLQLLQQSQHEQAQFYALTCLERLVLQPHDLIPLRELLLSPHFASHGASSYLKNKIAVLLVHLLLQDPMGWTTIMSDLLGMAESKPDVFLRTMIILVQELLESDEKQQTRQVKDLLKGYAAANHMDSFSSSSASSYQQQSNNTLLQTLFSGVGQILYSTLHQQDGGHASADLSNLALQSIQAYLSWTTLDILTVNQQAVLELLLLALERPDTQLQCLTVWHEWVTSATCQAEEASRRGFNDDMIRIRMAILERIHQSDMLPYGRESAFDIDIVIQAASLVNVLGVDLLERQKLAHGANGDDSSTELRAALFQQVTDLFFRSFSYDDIDVSAAVIPFCLALVASMENAQDLLSSRLPQLLHILYQQLRYADDYSYDHEDEDDAEQEVFHAILCKAYTKMVRVAPEMCLQFACDKVAQFNKAAAPSSDSEAMLQLIYHYCEGIRPAPGLKIVMRNLVFCRMLVELHTSDLSNHAHPEVLLMYYEVSVRYYPLFDQEEHRLLLSNLLQLISGRRGLQHSSPKIRSRSCYLLLRLAKSLTGQLRTHVDTAVIGIQTLLSSTEQELETDDKLNLFETMGLLLGKTGLEAAEQQRYLVQLLTPHIQYMEQVLTASALAANGSTSYGETLSNLIAAMAHLSKGFAKPPNEVRAIMGGTLPIALRVLEALSGDEQVRNKAMIFLQRMIICVDVQILPSMPQFLHVLVSHCDVEDVSFVSQVFIQLCIRFKRDALGSIDDALLPFLEKCHTIAAEITEGGAGAGAGAETASHVESELLSIKKLPYAVLSNIVMHNVTDVLISPRNVTKLEPVLRLVGEGAVCVGDPTVKRTCLRFFRDLAEQWAGIDSAYSQGLLTFLCHNLIPGVLDSMMDLAFDERDANQSKNTREFAKLLFALDLSNVATRIFSADINEALQRSTNASDIEQWLNEMFRLTKRAN